MLLNSHRSVGPIKKSIPKFQGILLGYSNNNLNILLRGLINLKYNAIGFYSENKIFYDVIDNVRYPNKDYEKELYIPFREGEREIDLIDQPIDPKENAKNLILTIEDRDIFRLSGINNILLYLSLTGDNKYNLIEYLKSTNLFDFSQIIIKKSVIQVNIEEDKKYLRKKLYIITKLFCDETDIAEKIYYLTNRTLLLQKLDNHKIFKRQVEEFFENWKKGEPVDLEFISSFNNFPSEIIVKERPNKDILKSIKELYSQTQQLIVKDTPVLYLNDLVENINILAAEYLDEIYPPLSLKEEYTSYCYIESSSKEIIDKLSITTRGFNLDLYSNEELQEVLYHIESLINSSNVYKYNKLRVAIIEKISK